mmetsp:Transcript_36402/g.114898  ORF Transcript_36402/g.114898 Transcript_36402/m.114898 type:complete len:220 (+) Transcript_36402:1-660(+)
MKFDETIQSLWKLTASEKDRLQVPVFATPAVDIKNGHGVKNVFVHETKGLVEITAIFRDKSIQRKKLTKLLRVFVKPLWGRTYNVRTIVYKKPHGIVQVVEFPRVYAGKGGWSTRLARGTTAKVSLGDFQMWGTTNRPLIWVNTRGHLLGERNNNVGRGVEYTEVAGYNVYRGSREEVDDMIGRGLMNSRCCMPRRRQNAIVPLKEEDNTLSSISAMEV